MTKLSHLGKTPAIDSLIAGMRAKDPATRVAARNALVNIGNREVVAALIAELNSSEAHVRREAAKSLGEISDPKSAAALMNLLDDEEPDVRWVAANGLAGLGKVGLETVLHGLTRYGYSIQFCHSAHHVLHELAKQGFGGAVKPVLTALEALEPTLAAPNAAYDQLLELGYI